MRQCTTTQTEEQQMDQGFTPSAALALGRAFRFVRQAREMTLREAAKAAGVSVQYVMNIEMGQRVNVSGEIIRKIARAYQIDAAVLENLLLKARMMSALERRGLDAAQQAVVWRRLNATLTELGFDTQESVLGMVSALYG
jgi:transcriptional regulator with XRE-family HTH domain